ncbi:sterol desaturase family protein [Nodosilinea sp. AN01ver1]|uniref:sterol desaturase family protein n=1 Tax=Nodosilinea sp. AN01ver1 TaxID=3423362 RepID=UPI003D31C44A
MPNSLAIAAVLVLPGLIGAIFLALFLAERVRPLRQPTRPLWQRLKVNAGVTAIAALLNLAVVQTAAYFTIQRAEGQGFGLVRWLPMPPLVTGAAAFLLLDLTFYYWHRANHGIPFLWRFHNAHHIDPDLDVSTGFRFHFGEMVFSAGLRAAQVALIGASLGTYLLYELVYQSNTLFHHSNLRLPLALERRLTWLLVTPRMHGIHHSQVREETNSNYGVIFPWWDRLHQTLRLNVPQSDITIGVPAYTDPADNQLVNVLRLPFQPQRDYWLHQQPIACDPAVVGQDRSKLVNAKQAAK